MNALLRVTRHEWPCVQIVDFARTSAGGTPKKSGKEFYDGGDIPWLLSGEVGARDILGASHFITASGLANSSAKLFPAGSVLVAMYGATAGEAGILRFESATNQAVCAILPSARHTPEYLYYYLLFAKPNLVAQAVGNAQPNISQAKIKATAVPLPPLDEQKRIVAVLDQAFAALDRARALAEANLADARELFDNARQELLCSTGNGVATSLGDEIELLVGFAFKSSGYVEAGDSIRLLRGDNIIQGSLRWEDAKHWPTDAADDYARFSLREGDVVLAMDRPWVKAGLKRAFLQADDVPALLVQRTACLRAGARMDNRYLFQLISGDEFSRHLLGVQTGIGVPHISGQQIKDFSFKLPSLAEQHRIVSKLDELQDKSRGLEAIYSRQLADLATLRQSLLQKAFAGELT